MFRYVSLLCVFLFFAVLSLISLGREIEARWINPKTGQIFLAPTRLNLGPESHPATVFKDQAKLLKLGIHPLREIPPSDPGPYYRRVDPKDSFGPDGVTIVRRYTLSPALSIADLRARAQADLVSEGRRALKATHDEVLESLELSQPVPDAIVRQRALIRSWFKATRTEIQKADYDTLVKMLPLRAPVTPDSVTSSPESGVTR